MKVEHLTMLAKHRMKRYHTRRLDQITQIVIHHSAAPANQQIADIAKYHVNHHGWPGIAYHYVVSANGQPYMTQEANVISYHAAGANTISLGICLLGDFTSKPPPPEQLAACRELIAALREQIPSITRVIPHNGVTGSSTACPGASFPMSLLESIPAPPVTETDEQTYSDLVGLYSYLDITDAPEEVRAAFNRLRRLPGMPPL